MTSSVSCFLKHETLLHTTSLSIQVHYKALASRIQKTLKSAFALHFTGEKDRPQIFNNRRYEIPVVLQVN